MRGKVGISLVAVVCLVAAGLYLSPAALGKVEQLVGVKQAASTDKQTAAADKPAKDAARSASIVSAVTSTADFPVRRYAIGFVSFGSLIT